MRRTIFLVILVWSLLAPAVSAQAELAHERASLQGLGAFYLSVNIEGPRAVLGQEALDLPRLRARLAARLEEEALTVRPDADVSPEDRVPYLHVHVNTMDAGRGLIPFSIELRLYQGVRLLRKPDRPLAAATWSSSSVGLVSHDKVALISDAAVDLMGAFADEVRRASR